MKPSFLCTAKLRRELGVKDKELSAVDPKSQPLAAWYADLIRIGPKKSVILVHPKTRYILVALDRKRPEIKELSELFCDLFRRVLHAEGVGDLLISDILGEDHEDSLILKTADKSVIGTMTEMVRTIRWEFDVPEEVIREREVALSMKLSDTPIVSLKYHFPYEKMSELLRDHYGFTGNFARERGFPSFIPAPIQEEKPLPAGVTSLRAERLWRSLSPDLQRGILGAVWCGECSTSREMVDFKLLVRNDMVVLEGNCATCGGPCVRVIEEE
jgi:hypothetical protein